MAAVNHEMFKKFKQLSLRQEGDGIEVEVREDEEQGIKLQEIIDLLVAAGYFRARIKGLSPFDKVVGGMTWCIESCNVDVDVDLLFQENSTIGQKIALTEKIVAVLPKLKCPHLIEPHQIQGLDFIHIYPVIQWLVKRSMEFRQEMSAFVRSYAVNQFNKEFPSTTKNDAEQKLIENVNFVKEVYRPRRYYKRKTGPPEEIESRVQVTLLEYGLRGAKKIVQNKSLDSEDFEEESSEQIDKFLNSMAEMNEDQFMYEDLAPEDREKLAKHYAALQSEFQDGGLKSREEAKLLVLEQQKQLILDRCKELDEDKSNMEKEITELMNSLQIIRNKQQKADDSFKQLDDTSKDNPENVKEVEDLVVLNDNLRSQELTFREHCKQELVELQNLIEETKRAKTTPTLNEGENTKCIEEETEKLRILRLQLAKKNRTVAALQRQLDDVPSRAELAQYQRRFLELYNQVASKHKETKQYYTLYNTLEDTRQYMKREMSLLNSISDSYPEAMQSNSGKEEFLKQFENIAENVRQSKLKVDKRLLEEKYKRDQLSYKLQGLVELQRKYAGAVRQLGIECKNHEQNFAQLGNS